AREGANERNRQMHFDPKSIDAVILSHAHIDHSGNLPQLAKQGFGGLIYTTPASSDLLSTMLRDAACIQEQDAKFINKHRKPTQPEVEPLYSADDVVRIMERVVAVPYHVQAPATSGVQFTLHDAGHILGSAVVTLDLEERGVKRRVGFTGD